MKSFRKLSTLIIVSLFLTIAIFNLMYFKDRNDNSGRPYIVEIERVCSDLNSGKLNIQDLDYGRLSYIENICVCNSDEDITSKSKYDYIIKNINGKLYRIEYTYELKSAPVLLTVNIVMGVACVVLIFVLLYIDRRIIKPFNQLETVPYELAKGNLTVDLKENKTKFFGKYIWGTNMLKESLENRRKKELEMHREKKTLLLSLTHDIKTPLSVIKLNTQALQKGLYKEENEKQEALSSIKDKVDEIENYVTKIISASKDDFLDLSVKDGEFYLADVIEKIRLYYKEKLELKHIEFIIEEYKNYILFGDFDRVIEVMQNLIENAIKYGDGHMIGISFGKEEECSLITVYNTGASLDKAEFVHIFDSFYRGSNTNNEEGSGLGLYICRKLMNNMNGDIFAKTADGMFEVTIVVRMNN